MKQKQKYIHYNTHKRETPDKQSNNILERLAALG